MNAKGNRSKRGKKVLSRRRARNAAREAVRAGRYCEAGDYSNARLYRLR